MSNTVVVTSKDRTIEYARYKEVQLVEFIKTVIPFNETRVIVKDQSGQTHTFDPQVYDVITLDL